MVTEVSAGNQPARAGKRRAYSFYGDPAIVHVSGDETGGRFCLVELLQPPGEWTPLHVHKSSDQTQYVVEGELTVYLPDRSVVVGPGECVTTPMGVPHTERVTSTGPARVLDVNAPAGFDEFVAEAGQLATDVILRPDPEEPPDLERLSALAVKYDIELLGPPGALP
jgi:mannose-6-phosphate isomerase-like protein (cupin superfamily)